MTTTWRKRAYDTFGFKPGGYSYSNGKVELFGDLRDMAKRAVACGDTNMLDRIFDYAMWADSQNAEGLRSAADIEFFMPVCRDPELVQAAESRMPSEVLIQKHTLLVGD